MADIRATTDKEEARLRRTTTLRNRQKQGNDNTRCKAKQPRTGKAQDAVGVEAGEGDTKLCKDYTPRLDDAPCGYTG